MGEYSGKDEEGVMYPFKSFVLDSIYVMLTQHVYTVMGCGKVQHELVINMFGGLKVGYQRLCGLRICGDLNSINALVVLGGSLE